MLAAVVAALSIAAVIIGILAFSRNEEIIDIAPEAETPMVFDGEIVGATDSLVPIPMPTETPTVTKTPTPTATPSPKREGDGLFTLGIKDSTIAVAYGVEEKTLDKTPGWLTTSALPGQDGMCVVYGHRNRNHLKTLENVEYGDAITVTMQSGETYRYLVCDITIYENTSDFFFPAMDGKTLVLVTCYPFRYSGHAPGKCVVTATLL